MANTEGTPISDILTGVPRVQDHVHSAPYIADLFLSIGDITVTNFSSKWKLKMAVVAMAAHLTRQDISARCNGFEGHLWWVNPDQLLRDLEGSHRAQDANGGSARERVRPRLRAQRASVPVDQASGV